jgi:hypothetical protein
MKSKQFVSAVVALLLVTAGVTVSTAGSVAAAESTNDDAVLTATYDNGTVSVTATDNGTAIDNASVTANDMQLAVTDENGTAAFNWNGEEGDELSITVEGDNATVSGTWVLQNGSLAEPASDADEEPTLENASVDASYDNGTVALEVADNGTGVSNVSVTANGEDVGDTDENGTLAFDWSPSEQENETETDTNETENETETETHEVDLVLEKDNTTRELTLTYEDGTLTREQEEEREGPPTDMPEQVPSHVEAIHQLIGKFLQGDLDAPLGELVSDVAGNGHGQSDEAKGHGNGAGQPEETGASNQSASASDNPGNGNGQDKGGNGHGNGDEGDHPGNGQGNGNGKAKGHN